MGFRATLIFRKFKVALNPTRKQEIVATVILMKADLIKFWCVLIAAWVLTELDNSNSILKQYFETSSSYKWN